MASGTSFTARLASAAAAAATTAAFACLVRVDPALCIDSSCSLSRGRGPGGYEFSYPSSWVFEKARGIEVLAHDPARDESNMSITTAPAQRVRLGSVQELGHALVTRYKALPNVEQVELLDMDDLEEDDGSSRYTYSLRLSMGNELRHLALGVLKTDSKVYTLALQVAEDEWGEAETCLRGVVSSVQPPVGRGRGIGPR